MQLILLVMQFSHLYGNIVVHQSEVATNMRIEMSDVLMEVMVVLTLMIMTIYLYTQKMALEIALVFAQEVHQEHLYATIKLMKIGHIYGLVQIMQVFQAEALFIKVILYGSLMRTS